MRGVLGGCLVPEILGVENRTCTHLMFEEKVKVMEKVKVKK